MRRLLRWCSAQLIHAVDSRGRLLLRALARLFPMRRDTELRVQGHRMAAHSPDRLATLIFWKFGWLEREERLLFEREVRPGMTAIDVGANIGFHTLLLARLVGPGGRVFSLEPEQDNFALLEKNVRLNGYSNVRCLRKAAFSRTDRIPLFYCEEHRGDHRVFDSDSGRPAVPVDAASLDDLFPAPERVDFIKMDIQGSEPLALEGMGSLLARSPGVKVLCEFFPRLIALSGHDPLSFLEAWSRLGFSAHGVDGDGNARPERDLGRLLAMALASGHVNLLFARPGALAGPPRK